MENNDNFNCMICKEVINNKNCTLTICGHKFHTSCILQWGQISPLCPYCRTNIINLSDEPL